LLWLSTANELRKKKTRSLTTKPAHTNDLK